MQREIDLAIKKLNGGEFSLVAINGDKIHTDCGLGVKPIIKMMRDNKNFYCGYTVADKVIGKAAALLLVLSGAKYVYGSVMSKMAVNILEKNNIPHSYGSLVEYIENRTHDGMCPLEDSVKDTDDEVLAFDLIEKRISELMKK